MDKAENPFLLMDEQSLRQLLCVMSANIRKFDLKMISLAVCAMIEKSALTNQMLDQKT